MVQNNMFFLLFFAGVILIIDYMLPIKKRVPFLSIVSFLFYFICDKTMLLLLLGIILVSFMLGLFIEKSKSKRLQKIYFTMGIIACVCIWCIFKYFDFFILNFINLIGVVKAENVKQPISLLLPLGISYYILKVISYLTDILKKKIKAEENFFNYALYVSFFPQIICGPIERPQVMLEQFRQGLIYKKEVFFMGCAKLTEGVFKKTVIANRLSGYVNIIFDTPDAYPSLALWMAGFFFTIQLYCDFSGYSDIAIGICDMFGVQCSPNFMNPLLSKSIKEFWRRWHISLSTWLRDYIYIPLGGNKKGKWRHGINTLTTFIVSGIWHGTGLTYIIWGLYNGILNLISSGIGRKEKNIQYNKKNFFKTSINFILVMFGFVFFRSADFHLACKFFMKMFCSFELNMNAIVNSILPFTMDYNCASYFLTVIFMIIILYVREYRVYYGYTKEYEKKLWPAVFLILTLFFGVFGEDSFLYANF